MNILVTAKRDVAGAYRDHRITHLLTLLDKQEEFVLPDYVNRNTWLRINFADVMDTNHEYAPTREHVKEALNWAKELPSDTNLLVHCYAGISRSTAMAMAILTQRYGIIDHCVNHIYSMRKNCCPNPLITQYADDILGWNGKFHEYAQSKVTSLLVNVASNKESTEILGEERS